MSVSRPHSPLRETRAFRPLSGYAAGFDLPLDATKVVLGSFTPGTGLDPGQPPLAAQAVIPHHGPLAGMLVTVQSQMSRPSYDWPIASYRNSAGNSDAQASRVSVSSA